MEQSKYTISAACYCRLSKDDENDGTSVSIETQQQILSDYCEKNQMKVFDFYSDDGFTGTNFNRPDFIRMMSDVEKGLVNTIVVKDLSRFGRNYLEVGKYIEEVFPETGVRFIAIGDDVDTEKENIDLDLLLPMKNLFNQFYPADCSRKTRQALKSKAQKGEFIGSTAAYGYKKSKADKHILEIDENTAPIVERIFRMAAYENCGCNKIAKLLTAEKVMTPMAYAAKTAGRAYSKNPYDWNLTTVYTNYSALNARAEVGITLLKAHRGKGLGSQALQLLEIFAVQRLRIHTLYANISPNNKASLNLFIGNGYKQVATLPEWQYSQGKYHDMALFMKFF